MVKSVVISSDFKRSGHIGTGLFPSSRRSYIQSENRAAIGIFDWMVPQHLSKCCKTVHHRQWLNKPYSHKEEAGFCEGGREGLGILLADKSC